MRKPTPNLRERALGYLTRREYSRAELYRKLQPYVVDEDLDALLEDFKARGKFRYIGISDTSNRQDE